MSSGQDARVEEALRALLSRIAYVEPRPGIVELAGGLADRYGLRAYDAVHLASALVLEDPELIFTTWDRDLSRAARARGLVVAS